MTDYQESAALAQEQELRQRAARGRDLDSNCAPQLEPVQFNALQPQPLRHISTAERVKQGMAQAEQCRQVAVQYLRQSQSDAAQYLVQMYNRGQANSPRADLALLKQAAARGAQGATRGIPFQEQIQKSFGKHDITSVQSLVGGNAEIANKQMGSEAYAMGNTLSFKRSPDLHTAAHEAAHVIQQRGGVQLKSGVGQVGDAYEVHADQVADLVVQGSSAESLLDKFAARPATQTGAVVQHKSKPKTTRRSDEKKDTVKPFERARSEFFKAYRDKELKKGQKISGVTPEKVKAFVKGSIKSTRDYRVLKKEFRRFAKHITEGNVLRKLENSAELSVILLESKLIRTSSEKVKAISRIASSGLPAVNPILNRLSFDKSSAVRDAAKSALLNIYGRTITALNKRVGTIETKQKHTETKITTIENKQNSADRKEKERDDASAKREALVLIRSQIQAYWSRVRSAMNNVAAFNALPKDPEPASFSEAFAEFAKGVLEFVPMIGDAAKLVGSQKQIVGSLNRVNDMSNRIRKTQKTKNLAKLGNTLNGVGQVSDVIGKARSTQKSFSDGTTGVSNSLSSTSPLPSDSVQTPRQLFDHFMAKFSGESSAQVNAAREKAKANVDAQFATKKDHYLKQGSTVLAADTLRSRVFSGDKVGQRFVGDDGMLSPEFDTYLIKMFRSHWKTLGDKLRVSTGIRKPRTLEWQWTPSPIVDDTSDAFKKEYGVDDPLSLTDKGGVDGVKREFNERIEYHGAKRNLDIKHDHKLLTDKEYQEEKTKLYLRLSGKKHHSSTMTVSDYLSGENTEKDAAKLKEKFGADAVKKLKQMFR